MLLGCGCNCQEDSVSSANGSAVSMSESSVVFPSQSTWPNSTGYPDPPADRPCLACVGYVRPTAYRVDLGDMPQQQPTIFGDWNCVEMLQPFKTEIGWSGLVPLSPPAVNQVNCAYTTGWGNDGTPPPIGSVTDCSKSYAGYFHPNYAGNFYACGQFPLCDLVLFTKYNPVTFVPFYQIKLTMAFYGFGECNPLSVPPFTHYLQVEYATDISDKQFACLNQIRLQWQRAIGNLERQNPDGPGWESYGIGPGNHRSYEFHRGTFPEEITIRPWGT